jgi:acyl-coenzyme A synthetase/AMP-(fatty) acid ligase
MSDTLKNVHSRKSGCVTAVVNHILISLRLIYQTENDVDMQVVSFSQEKGGEEELLAGESSREVDLGDPAMILYTSGTTGPPKVQLLREVRGGGVGEVERQGGEPG